MLLQPYAPARSVVRRLVVSGQFCSQTDSHSDRAIELFPAALTPKFAAARIIRRHHDVGGLETDPTQTCQTLIDQSLTHSPAPISRIDRQMIDVSAPSIMTTEHHPDDRRSICRDETQARIAREKLRDAFPIVAFRDLDAFDPVPQLNRGRVILDRKFPRLNFHSMA